MRNNILTPTVARTWKQAYEALYVFGADTDAKLQLIAPPGIVKRLASLKLDNIRLHSMHIGLLAVKGCAIDGIVYEADYELMMAVLPRLVPGALHLVVYPGTPFE